MYCCKPSHLLCVQPPGRAGQAREAGAQGPPSRLPTRAGLPGSGRSRPSGGPRSQHCACSLAAPCAPAIECLRDQTKCRCGERVRCAPLQQCHLGSQRARQMRQPPQGEAAEGAHSPGCGWYVMHSWNHEIPERMTSHAKLALGWQGWRRCTPPAAATPPWLPCIRGKLSLAELQQRPMREERMEWM